MRKGIVLMIAGTLVLSLNEIRGYSQDLENEPVRIMFYNTENLFDIYDDTLKEDNDFLPEGGMNWTSSKYKNKINRLYKTIVAAGASDPPEIIALCEVEKRKNLTDLVSDTYLAKYHYEIIHEDSPDRRGIDVCLLFRDERIKLLDYKYWIPAVTGREDYLSRSVLFARLLVMEDTLNVIVNHWPSRRGGVLAAGDLRLRVAEMVKSKADSILNVNTKASKLIILGDFNSQPEDRVIRILVENPVKGNGLINLSMADASKGRGTYRYMGVWEMIDQIIVSASLIDSEEGIYTEARMFEVFSPDFLLRKDPVYPGSTPFSTYRGFDYQGGYSDHLPVLLDLGFR